MSFFSSPGARCLSDSMMFVFARARRSASKPGRRTISRKSANASSKFHARQFRLALAVVPPTPAPIWAARKSACSSNSAGGITVVPPDRMRDPMSSLTPMRSPSSR